MAQITWTKLGDSWTCQRPDGFVGHAGPFRGAFTMSYKVPVGDGIIYAGGGRFFSLADAKRALTDSAKKN